MANTNERFPLPFNKNYEKNRGRRPPQDWCGQSCLICGRPIKDLVESTFVHMTTDLELVPAGEHLSEDDGSQGCFPVGPECAKKVPAKFRLRNFLKE